MRFCYSEIEQQLVEALPEIRPAAEKYWQYYGEPGTDPGPYVFVPNVLGCYLDILAALPTSRRRDELLSRTLLVLDQALVSGDTSVWSLVMDLYAGRTRAWFRAARQFVGPRSAATLDAFQAGWDDDSVTQPSELDEIFDLYDVGSLVAEELRRSGETPGPMPTRLGPA